MYFWAAWRIFSRSMDDNSSVAVGELGGRAETIRSAKSYELSRVWSRRVGGFAAARSARSPHLLPSRAQRRRPPAMGLGRCLSAVGARSRGQLGLGRAGRGSVAWAIGAPAPIV